MVAWLAAAQPAVEVAARQKICDSVIEFPTLLSNWVTTGLNDAVLKAHPKVGSLGLENVPPVKVPPPSGRLPEN